MSEVGSTFLHSLRAALAPVFDEQRAVWEREGPAADARAALLGIVFDEIGGNCPLQAEGSFDQQRFYFRARYNRWRFHAWTGSEHYQDAENCDEWVVERPYGTDRFDAGWMHQHEAIHFICDCVDEYRAAEREQDVPDALNGD